MPTRGRVHDRAILDALEAIDPVPFDGIVWRITRTGRDPLRGSSANGRWGAAGELEVLYTSLEREGALAEIGYRMSLEPVWPTRMGHEIHEIGVHAERTLVLASVADLKVLGIDVAAYGTFNYVETQAIAAAAHFLDYDGMIVPSARYSCQNLVIFIDRIAAAGKLEVRSSAVVDWDEWRRHNKRTGAG